MAGHSTLTALPRDIIGKKVKQLRRHGRLPGIVYGPVMHDPRPVTVDAQEFDLVYRHAGSTALVDLSLDGETHTVFIREVERHAVRKAPLHVNFYAPVLNRPIDASVPVVTIGHPPAGVDGVLTQNRHDVLIRALPGAVPQQIEADISRMTDVHRAVLVGDLVVPPGVELLTPFDEIVVSVEAPTVTEAVVQPDAQDVLAQETGDRPAGMEPDTGPIEERR